MTTDEPPFTELPWSADVARIIYAVNGRPGLTNVATLLDGAPASLLAAAPDLFLAVADSMECLENHVATLSSGALRVATLDALNFAQTAIARVRVGYPNSTVREHLWTVNPALPDAEKKANARVLDAAADLLRAAHKVYAALAGHVDNPAVVDWLSKAILRADEP